MWQQLTHANPPGRDCQGRATLFWVGGEGRRGAAERGAPAAQHSGLLLCCWQGAARGACEQEIKSSGRGFFLTNRGFVCLFSWWF